MNQKELLQDVKAVVDMYSADEKKHYTECDHEGRRVHIYKALVRLRNHLRAGRVK